jgi:sugar/nucleoside kinase (ribokinase family)
MLREKRIVVCGHICLDIIPAFPLGAGQDYFRPGRLSIVDAAVTATGGTVPNVGLSLHKLGLPVRLVGKVGKDPFGTIVVGNITAAAAGLAQGIAAIDGQTTSYTVVINPPGVDRVFFHCPGANDTFTEADVPESAYSDSSIFHFGYPPLMKSIWSDGGQRLRGIFTRARAGGALTSLDMSLPDPNSPSGRVDWGAFLAHVLPAVDLFVPSVEEFLFMSDRAVFDALSAGKGGDAIVREITLRQTEYLASKAITTGVSAVLIKMGDRGAYLRTGPKGVGKLPKWSNRELYTPVFRVPAVGGTTGAGDATIAGFLASVSKGIGPDRALTFAEAVGACCVEAPDATSGVRSWAETEDRISNGWECCPARITDPGWRRLESGVWAGPADLRS